MQNTQPNKCGLTPARLHKQRNIVAKTTTFGKRLHLLQGREHTLPNGVSHTEISAATWLAVEEETHCPCTATWLVVEEETHCPF